MGIETYCAQRDERQSTTRARSSGSNGKTPPGNRTIASPPLRPPPPIWAITQYKHLYGDVSFHNVSIHSTSYGLTSPGLAGPQFTVASSGANRLIFQLGPPLIVTSLSGRAER
jgi:hypothetical protein